MAFALLSCPYCGGTVTPSDDRYHVCVSCGKKIFKSRSYMSTFVEAVGMEDEFLPIIEMVESDNLPKALSTIDEMIEEAQETNADMFFIRGMVYANMGEDGKALTDWKRGLEMMETFYNVDAYVCLIARSISDLLYYKEREFITFDHIKYIDRVGEILDECTGDSCMSVIYYSVFRTFGEKMDEDNVPYDDSLFTGVVHGIFRRIIEYHRNYKMLMIIIENFLNKVGYNDETYEEDDNYDFHLYYLVKIYLEAYTSEAPENDVERVMRHWNDKSMKVLENQFEEIAACIRDDKLINLAKYRSDECSDDLRSGVNEYVKKYLVLTNDESEESEML